MSIFRDKQWWLDAAEVFDAWRIAPRVLLFGYWIWVAWIVDRLLSWYMALPADERSMEASGMATFVITAVTGLASWISKIYMHSGRLWTHKRSE